MRKDSLAFSHVRSGSLAAGSYFRMHQRRQLTGRRKSGRERHVPAPKGSQSEGPQTRRLEGTGIDLAERETARAPTQRLDTLVTNPVKPTQLTFITQFSSEDREDGQRTRANPKTGVALVRDMTARTSDNPGSASTQ